MLLVQMTNSAEHTPPIWPRDELRLQLFGLPQGTVPQPNTVPSLAQITRETPLQAKYKPGEAERRVEIATRVGAIIRYHDYAAHHEPETPTLFGIINPEDVERVTEITNTVIGRWVKACNHRKIEHPFDNLPAPENLDPNNPEALDSTVFSRPDVRLVIETASAVCELHQAGYPIRRAGGIYDRAKRNTRTDRLANLLAKQGVEFAKAWMRGDIIRNYCDSIGANADEWLRVLGRGERARIILQNPARPLEATREFAETHRGLLVKRSLRNWIETREGYRRYLFDPPSSGPLSGYHKKSLVEQTSETKLPQRHITDHELEAFASITANVEKILKRHDYNAHNPVRHHPSNRPSIFGITNELQLARVVDITAQTIWIWRRAFLARPHYGYALPFADLTQRKRTLPDFGDPLVQTVIETASAVCEVLQAGYSIGVHGGNEIGVRHIARLIAVRGPEFAKAWMRGDIVRQHCAENNLNADFWLNVLSPFWFLQVPLVRPLDPIAKMQEVVHRFVHVLTVPNIRGVSGWSSERVIRVFPRHILSLLAMRENKPMPYIRRIVYNMDHSMTTENIAAELSITPETADEFCSQWLRINLAQTRVNPVDNLKTIFKAARQLVGEYRLTPKLAAYLARHRGSGAHTMAEIIVSQRSKRPPTVTEADWDWATAKYPSPNDPRRMRHLAELRVIRSIQNPYSLQGSIEPGGRQLQERVGDAALDPAEILMEQEAGDLLLGLAQRSGVPLPRLQQLLKHFGETGESPESGPLKEILDRLRDVADEEGL